jgi:predicted lipoprotein with Yx(FWY)xxD motif
LGVKLAAKALKEALEGNPMRKMMFAAALALALSTGAMSAQAQMMPSGVKMANGAMTDASGKPLYTYDNDTMVGMSHCNGRCIAAWPPLLADASAKPMGDWTIINRDDGAKQWAYKNKPLYTFAKDTAGQPGTGEAAGNPWKLAK